MLYIICWFTNQSFTFRHVTQLSTNQIVSQSTQDLHRLTALVRGKDKLHKLQVEALRSRFKEAVNLYSSKQKVFITSISPIPPC